MSEYQFNPDVEQWQDIPNFPGYQVSDRGRVRTYWKIVSLGWRKGIKLVLQEKSRGLKSSVGYKGYLFVTIAKEKKYFRKRIHRLELTAFVGPCPPGMEGCHNEGRPSNLNLTNLRWDTPKNNRRDMIKHGTVRKGEQINTCKLTKTQVSEIRSLEHCGISQKKISNIYGISQVNVWAILRRKTWKHI